MTGKFNPVDAKGLANLLLDWADRAGVPVTPMKLQKLAYYCHAEFLLATGEPLIAQDFEAWDYGPVIPGLFHEFKSFGGEPITSRASGFDPITAQRRVASPALLGAFERPVRDAFEFYAKYSASALSRMSHIQDGPWSEALMQFQKGRNAGRKISNGLILAHHRSDSCNSLH
jgi:uncharacterized phage-associated protein